jgi:hypothetical protein
MIYTLKAVDVVDTPRGQLLNLQGFGDGRPLRVIKRDDAKIQAFLFISSGDPDDHANLLHILAPRHQLQGSALPGWYTYLVTVSSFRFFSFPNVDECYARVIHDLVA